MKLKREQVIPGTIVTSIYEGKRGVSSGFFLNGDTLLTDGATHQIMACTRLRVLSKPRKKNGVNLVQIEVIDTGLIGEVFYTDLVLRCLGSE